MIDSVKITQKMNGQRTTVWGTFLDELTRARARRARRRTAPRGPPPEAYRPEGQGITTASQDLRARFRLVTMILAAAFGS